MAEERSGEMPEPTRNTPINDAPEGEGTNAVPSGDTATEALEAQDARQQLAEQADAEASNAAAGGEEVAEQDARQQLAEQREQQSQQSDDAEPSGDAEQGSDSQLSADESDAAEADAPADDTNTDGAPAADASTDGAPAEGADGSAVASTPSEVAPLMIEAARPTGMPAIITTTTLFFLAPDLPPVIERRSPRRNDFDERGGRAGNEHAGSRRGGDPRGAASDRDARDSDDNDSRQDARGTSSRTRRRGRYGRDTDTSARRPQHDQHDDARSSDRGDDTNARREPELITEPQKIKGSTRLEAKRQRRREGREIGRRRPVVTESEFLARREAVDRLMLVRAKDNRVQIGVLEDKVLVEHYVARSQESSLIGNVYLGRVQNVLPSMEAAFIDIGRGRNAVLYSGEVDWSAAELGSGQARRIENALKPGDRVLVQVTKDPVGHKGARLTSQVSLPGRYLVYVPGNAMNGISRKLPDTERTRLKKILKEVLPPGVGVIVRTAAEGATREQLERDVNRLTQQWEDIQKRVSNGPAPALLHSEPDLLIKIIRDVFNEDFQKIVIQGSSELETISNYLGQVAPDLLERVEAFQGDDVFATYRANEHIEKALDRKVWLPSGGSLVIDRTEAMTVVDVNTGKFVGSGGNLEETVTKNNLEAAEEVVRQLRLRDIGGIIVIDFIDMVLESNRDLVLRRLVECLSRDRTKHQVAEVTSLGLVQMTRKKLGLGLLETFSEPCATCAGRGVLVSHDPVAKHRATDDGPSNRRGRGGRGSGQQDGGRNSSSNGAGANAAPAHGITDEARGALSRIAASTIAGSQPRVEADEAPEDQAAASRADDTASEATSGASDGADTAAQPAQGESPQGERREGGRRSRRGRRRGANNGNQNAQTAQNAEEVSRSTDADARDAEAAQGRQAELNVTRQDGTEESRDDRVADVGLDLPAPREQAEPAASHPDRAGLDALSSALDALTPVGSGDHDEGGEDVAGEESLDHREVAASAPEIEDDAAPETPVDTEPRGYLEPEAESERAIATEEPARGASGRVKRRRVTVSMDVDI